jgi:translation initiation factor IF-3
MVQHRQVKFNGRIEAVEVRVITEDDTELGVYSLEDACHLAQTRGVDLVEVGPDESPPTCRLIDYGRFRFQQQQPMDDSTPTI